MKIATWFLLTLNHYLVVNRFFIKKPKVLFMEGFQNICTVVQVWETFSRLAWRSLVLTSKKNYQ